MTVDKILILTGIGACILGVVIMAIVQLQLMSRYGPSGALSRRITGSEFRKIKYSALVFLCGIVLLLTGMIL